MEVSVVPSQFLSVVIEERENNRHRTNSTASAAATATVVNDNQRPVKDCWPIVKSEPLSDDNDSGSGSAAPPGSSWKKQNGTISLLSESEKHDLTRHLPKALLAECTVEIHSSPLDRVADKPTARPRFEAKVSPVFTRPPSKYVSPLVQSLTSSNLFDARQNVPARPKDQRNRERSAVWRGVGGATTKDVNTNGDVPLNLSVYATRPKQEVVSPNRLASSSSTARKSDSEDSFETGDDEAEIGGYYGDQDVLQLIEAVYSDPESDGGGRSEDDLDNDNNNRSKERRAGPLSGNSSQKDVVVSGANKNRLPTASSALSSALVSRLTAATSSPIVITAAGPRSIKDVVRFAAGFGDRPGGGNVSSSSLADGSPILSSSLAAGVGQRPASPFSLLGFSSSSAPAGFLSGSSLSSAAMAAGLAGFASGALLITPTGAGGSGPGAGKFSFKCEHCPNVYPNRGALWQHSVATHSIEKTCECKICGRKFYRNCSLALHLKSHSEEEYCACKECGKSFTRLVNLERHMKVHSDHSEQLQCDQCDKIFSDRANLLRHSVCHSAPPVRSHQCDACGKSYKSQDHLEIHWQAAHAAISCSVCDKSFSSFAELARHDATHTFEQRYLCRFCGKSYSQKAVLRKHMIIHTGERLRCSQCGIEFTQRSSLLRHVKRMHSNSGGNGHANNINHAAPTTLPINFPPHSLSIINRSAAVSTTATNVSRNAPSATTLATAAYISNITSSGAVTISPIQRSAPKDQIVAAATNLDGKKRPLGALIGALMSTAPPPPPLRPLVSTSSKVSASGSGLVAPTTIKSSSVEAKSGDPMATKSSVEALIGAFGTTIEAVPTSTSSSTERAVVGIDVVGRLNDVERQHGRRYTGGEEEEDDLEDDLEDDAEDDGVEEEDFDEDVEHDDRERTARIALQGAIAEESADNEEELEEEEDFGEDEDEDDDEEEQRMVIDEDAMDDDDREAEGSGHGVYFDRGRFSVPMEEEFEEDEVGSDEVEDLEDELGSDRRRTAIENNEDAETVEGVDAVDDEIMEEDVGREERIDREHS